MDEQTNPAAAPEGTPAPETTTEEAPVEGTPAPEETTPGTDTDESAA